MNVDNPEVINVLSFCTGYAGLELGLSRVFTDALRCVAVEIEAFACANLVAKAEQGTLAIEAVYTDLKTFPAKRFRGCFDIITAGYPCQPFSHAGQRKGETDPRHLWPFIRDSIEQIEPVLVICENVAGHLSLGFDRVVCDLEDLGYTVEAGIYAASETGAPHRRERLFILAARMDDSEGWKSIVNTMLFRQTKTQNDRSGCTGPLCSMAHPESGGLGQAGQSDAGAANGTAGSGSIMDNSDDGRHGPPEKEVCPGGDATIDAGELADTDSRRSKDGDNQSQRAELEPRGDTRRRAGSRGDRPADTGCGQPDAAVSDSERSRCDTGPKRTGRQTGPDADRSGKRSGLADGDGSGCKEQCGPVAVRPEHTTAQYGGRQQWPARPGQKQYEWERPRTILSAADYKILKGYVEKYQTRLTKGQADAMACAKALYAPEPKMGRVAYGFASRVDELRLLGNGVVRQQCEMAIRDIIDKIIRGEDV